MALDAAEKDIVFRVLRRNVDSTGYGHWISDQLLLSTADQVEAALSGYRDAKAQQEAQASKKSKKGDD